VSNPTPWRYGKGYDQCDPGVYICDATGHIVVADTTENTLTEETAKRICDAVNASAADPPAKPEPLETEIAEMRLETARALDSHLMRFLHDCGLPNDREARAAFAQEAVALLRDTKLDFTGDTLHCFSFKVREVREPEP
jgi:hypothetical protein